MAFTFLFVRVFLVDMLYAAPILLFLIALIFLIGLTIARIEHWSTFDGIYHAFINATTVGYGDFRPNQPSSKLLAICLAFTGLVFTGMIVAIALHAADHAFAEVYKTVGLPDRAGT